MERTFHEVVQRTPEWHALRLGRATCSEFFRFITPAKGKLSESKATLRYLYELAGEALTGRRREVPPTRAMEWGTENEPLAREVYEHVTGADVRQVGFVTLGPLLGGSPDGLVEEDGLMEIKCPMNTGVHLDTLISQEVPQEYLPQVHGLIAVTGRKWADFVSYDPRIESVDQAMVVLRVQRSAYTESVLSAATDFAERLAAIRVRLNIDPPPNEKEPDK